MTDQHDNSAMHEADKAQLDPFTAALLADAKRFDQDAMQKADRLVKRITVALVVALLVAGIAVACAVYQAQNTREVQPFVLLKDESKGTVTELVKVEPQQWSHGDAIDAANLAAYVRSREEYSDATVVYNFEQVELMSSGTTMDEYRLWIDPKENKLSPMALYPTGVVNIDVTSVVRMSRGAAQVHFKRTVKGVSNPPRPSNWIATVEFEYLTKNMTLAARLRNPLGFTVHSYNVDEAVVSVTTSPSDNEGRK